jgi:hypothetical protein
MLDFIFRAVNWDFGVFSSANDAVVPVADSERTSCEAVDAVKVARCYSRIRRTDCNCISLNEMPTVGNDVEYLQDVCRRLFKLHAAGCWLLLVFCCRRRSMHILI